MSVDRILQLKLVADVSDLNRKTGEVESGVGRIRGAFTGLKSFVGPAMLNLGIEAAQGLMDGLSGGFQAAEAYDRAFGELEANLARIPDAIPADQMAAQLDQLSFDLGFDDAETLAAFNELLTRTGNVDDAMTALNASFDLAASRGMDVGAAAAEVGNIFKGEAEKLAEWGVVLDEPVKNSITNVTTALGYLGDEAETRAASIEGVFDKIGVGSDRAFAFAASSLTDLAEDIMPKLAAAWAEWGPKVTEVAGKLGEMVGKALELASAIFDKLQPVLGPLVDVTLNQLKTVLDGISGLMDVMIDLLNGDFTGAWEGIQKTVGTVMDGIRRTVVAALNAVITAWNMLDFSIDFTLPNPAYGTVFDPVGSPNLLDIHTGDLIPDIPLLALARGGIVRRPTMALIGESGPEAVVPLDRGGMAPTINIYASAASPADVGRAVVEAIEAYERRAGSGWRS